MLQFHHVMFNRLFTSAFIVLCIAVIALNCIIVNAQDYDNDAYPDEDKRIGASVNEEERSHRNEKREDDTQPLGMKTSTVIEISADDANPVATKDEDQEEATISHTPNTKVQRPVTIKKTPKVISKGKGKEKTVLSQKLPQKPSRVVVDVKEKKDKNDPNGKKKKWETDLVVEGKPKKVPDEIDKVVTGEKANSSSEEEIDVESIKTKTEESIRVPGVKQDEVDVENVTENDEEIVETIKSPAPKVIEIIKSPASNNGGSEVAEVVKSSASEDVIEVMPQPPQTPEVIKDESTKDRDGNIKVEEIVENPENIDIENLGKNNKVVTALRENQHGILGDLRGGLTPDLMRWAEEAIAAGVENVVNAVEDKYIDYMKSRARRKRAAPSVDPDDDDDDDGDDDDSETSSKTLDAAMKKVQKAAAVLATSEAHNAVKAASTAAKLNMDVTSQAANNAMKSVASAIGAASKNAAKQIVDAENKAAAAALAGAAPVIVAGTAPRTPVIVTDAASAPAAVEEAAASAAAIEQAAAAAAAGAGSGRDLLQQTLQIQKGLNLVMRAVLKEKERVAADLARYQNKISFLLREMAGGQVGQGAVTAAGATRRRRRREVRRQRRALLTTQSLRQLLQREETRVSRMLRMLDTSVGDEKRKRAVEEDGMCRGSSKRRAGRSREIECGGVG